MFNLTNHPVTNITSVSDGIKLLLQGIPGSWYIANQLLKISGGHSNRTVQQFYDTESESEYMSTMVADLEIERLVAQLNIIENKDELIAGLIILMNSGLLLGHWQKFKFDTEVGLNKYRDIFNSQKRFESGQFYCIDQKTAEANRILFNQFHAKLNTILTEYYSELHTKINSYYLDFLQELAMTCPMTSEDYADFERNSIELMTKDEDNLLRKRLTSIINSGENPEALTARFFEVRKIANEARYPTKSSLYELFGTNRSRVDRIKGQFVSHLKESFNEDFADIINKLDLEIE